MSTTKRSSEGATLVAEACANVQGFSDMYRRLKRRMHTSGRSTSTLNNYARHIAKMALHYNDLPTELEEDQIETISTRCSNSMTLLQKATSNTPFMDCDSFFVSKDWMPNVSHCQRLNARRNFLLF